MLTYLSPISNWYLGSCKMFLIYDIHLLKCNAFPLNHVNSPTSLYIYISNVICQDDQIHANITSYPDKGQGSLCQGLFVRCPSSIVRCQHLVRPHRTIGTKPSHSFSHQWWQTSCFKRFKSCFNVATMAAILRNFFMAITWPYLSNIYDTGHMWS